MPRDGAPTRRAVLDALNKPGNQDQVKRRTNLSKTTVWRLVTALHAEGAIRIVGWRRTKGGGPFMATYKAGAGVDKPCPIVPYTEAEKSRRYHARQREERAELAQARGLALAWADRATQVRDPMIEAMFGPARRQTLTLEPA